MLRVNITMEGGVIQNMAIPDGVVVIVRDYDVDGTGEEQLCEDEHGDMYFQTEWHSSGTI